MLMIIRSFYHHKTRGHPPFAMTPQHLQADGRSDRITTLVIRGGEKLENLSIRVLRGFNRFVNLEPVNSWPSEGLALVALNPADAASDASGRRETSKIRTWKQRASRRPSHFKAAALLCSGLLQANLYTTSPRKSAAVVRSLGAG